MTQDTLREFFRARTKKANDQAAKVDWGKKRDSWLQAIEELYTIILKLLDRSIQDGSVTSTFADKQISEDYVGTYQARELVLQVGDEKVTFSPKGMNIVGATGRIDLRGDTGEVTVIRQPDNRWGFVVSRTPVLKVVPLSEESLLAVLQSVMRP
ncbi:MAG: hypothetical protein NT031_07100 [Planctomycetota bacterium]|nr:hypothetical protein [Planctomycetota bacterium]